MKIKVPISSRRKALFLVDIQPKTLSAKAPVLVGPIKEFVSASKYEAYVEANYYADERSMFFRQGEVLLKKADAGGTATEILTELEGKAAPKFRVEKNTRSCFKGFNSKDLGAFLRANRIEEIHLVGYDINDCVLASAYEAVDSGYFTYVIEELCHHWDGSEQLKEAALAVLRIQGLTNNSTKTDCSVVSLNG